MYIIPAEEFNSQARNYKKSSGIIYQGKIYIPGVVFAIKRRLAAIKYCQELIFKNSSFQCILVEDTNHIRVWYEKSSRLYLYKIPQQKNKQKSKLQNNSISSKFSASKNLPIDRDFVLQCQQTIAEFIGPIAKIFIKKTVIQNAQLNRQQFIFLLIKELEKNSKIPGLEQKLQQLLDDS